MSDTATHSRQPIAVKYVQSRCEGIQSRQFLRHGIGYVLRGKKYIHDGDTRYEANRGDLFYLKIGNHYTEETPENGKQYEEILFFYSPESISDILSMLSVNYHAELERTEALPAISSSDTHVENTPNLSLIAYDTFYLIGQLCGVLLPGALIGGIAALIKKRRMKSEPASIELAEEYKDNTHPVRKKFFSLAIPIWIGCLVMWAIATFILGI